MLSLQQRRYLSEVLAGKKRPNRLARVDFGSNWTSTEICSAVEAIVARHSVLKTIYSCVDDRFVSYPCENPSITVNGCQIVDVETFRDGEWPYQEWVCNS